MFRKELRISIDGEAATGKSTVSSSLSKKLKTNYLNTGSLYRIVTLFLIEKNKIDSSKEEIKEELQKLKFKFFFNKLFSNYVFEEKDLFSKKVSENIKKVANNKIIREYLLGFQKKVGNKKRIILEGRDIGTVIMPQAKYKFFLTIKPEIAAKRRLDQLEKDQKEKQNYKEILESIIKRNQSDYERKISPLKKPTDAIVVDTSELNQKEVIDKIFKIIKEKEKEQ